MDKAAVDDFPGRFREIISDPLNLLILRHPEAGTVADGMVRLHNGLQVPLEGPGAYYGDFSQILVLNRGVHEPLEEFAFQTLLETLAEAPVMIELGAYWAHYSMWMALRRPRARLILVEPDATNLAAGKANFQRNGFAGKFIQAGIGPKGLGLDDLLDAEGIASVDLVHADIQGAEQRLLAGAVRALEAHRVGCFFISTHSADLHTGVAEDLARHGYRIELSSEPDRHTTSFDGFICATAPERPALLRGLPLPPGRTDLQDAVPADLLGKLVALLPLVPLVR